MSTASTGARLIIVCGLPGAGKTTRARLLETRLGAVRLAPDEWMEALALDLRDEAARGRIEGLQWALARTLLARGLVVVLEWGTWARAERDVLRLGARSLGAAVELHHLAAPPHVLLERVRRRGREVPPLELADILAWGASFEAPSDEELALYDLHVEIGPDAESYPDALERGARAALGLHPDAPHPDAAAPPALPPGS